MFNKKVKALSANKADYTAKYVTKALTSSRKTGFFTIFSYYFLIWLPLYGENSAKRLTEGLYHGYDYQHKPEKGKSYGGIQTPYDSSGKPEGDVGKLLYNHTEKPRCYQGAAPDVEVAPL